MKAIVTGDVEYVVNSFDDLRPGAHAAVRASPTQLPDSGVALRLAGFEIRDTIAHVAGDRIVWWILARKPLDGTVANNVLAHGVGGLNIDASRVGSETRINMPAGNKANSGGVYKFSNAEVDAFNGAKPAEVAGRFPANVLLDEHAAKEMDEQSGVSASTQRTGKRSGKSKDILGDFVGQENVTMGHNDSGGASRFFPLLDEGGAENWIRRLIDPDQSP